MDANCILIFIHRLSNGSIVSMSFTISIVSFGKYLAKRPCFLAFCLPFILAGGAPVDLPPCIRHLPFAMALFLQGLPDLVLAPHKLSFFLFAWGSFRIYIYTTVLI